MKVNIDYYSSISLIPENEEDKELLKKLLDSIKETGDAIFMSKEDLIFCIE